MIGKGEALPVTQQCALLDLCRSGVYYQAVPVSAKDLELNALRADFKNLQHNKDLYRRHIAIQAYGV